MKPKEFTEFWLWRSGGLYQDSWYCFMLDENNKQDGAVVLGVNWDNGKSYGLNDRMGIEEGRALHKDLRSRAYQMIDVQTFMPEKGYTMNADELIRQYRIIDNAK